jgi:hypothetical protein
VSYEINSCFAPGLSETHISGYENEDVCEKMIMPVYIY